MSYHCLDAVVTAVDGDSLGVQRNGEPQLRGGEGVGDALDAVLTHHIGDRNRSHIECSFSFHQFLNGDQKVVHDLQMSVLDVLHHAGVNMVAEQLPGKGVQRRLDGGDLGEDVRAVALFFHHAPE